MADPIEIVSTPAGGSPVTVEYPVNAVEVTNTGGGAGGGGLTDAELRAAPVPVSGPVTDTQLRAAPVPVSGPVTDTQLRATALRVQTNSTPVVTGTLSANNANPSTGVPTANSTVEVDCDGFGMAVLQTVGTGAFSISPQITVDGVNWVTVPFVINTNTSATSAWMAASPAGIWLFPTHGAKRARVSVFAYTSGSVTAHLLAASDANIINGGRGSGGVSQVALTAVGSTGLSVAVPVAGQGAHSAIIAGNPVRIGGKVLTTVDTTLVNGDASDFLATTSGAIVAKPFAPPELDWQVTTTVSNATATTIKAAGSAGVRNYLTGLQVQNTSATPCTMLVFDTGGNFWNVSLPAAMANPTVVQFLTPLRGAAAANMQVQLSAAGSVIVNAQGYQAA